AAPRMHVGGDGLDYGALRLAAWGRPMGDLPLDELARLGVRRPPRRDQHFLLDLGVVGHDEADTTLFLIAPHDALVGTADHLDDRALPTSTTIEPGNPRQTAVAVEDQAHLRGAEKEVVALVVGNEETEAIAMTADAPADQIQLVHRGIGAAPGVDQLAVALHGAQPATKRFDVVFGSKPELVDQLLTRRRGATLVQMLENQLSAGNGVFVFLRFTRGLGIEGLPIGH